MNMKSAGSGGDKKPQSYGVPGQGKSAVISILVSALSLFFLWFIFTQPIFTIEEYGETLTGVPLIEPLFLPSPQAVWERGVEVWHEEFSGADLPTHLGWSMWRVFAAFLIALVLAVPIGLLMGVNRFARGIFDPPIEFYRPIPPLAYLPLIIIWFGIGEFPKILLIYLAIFAPMAIAARAGVRSVSIEQIHAAYAMGGTRMQIVWHVILKAAMPEIFTGMRIGIGVGWTTLVAAEMVAADRGLGFMVLNAAQFLASDTVIMGIIVIGVFAFAFDLLVRYLEKFAIPWKGRI